MAKTMFKFEESMPNKITFKDLFKREFFMGGILTGIPTAFELGWFWGVVFGLLGGLIFAFGMAFIFSNWHWPQSKDPGQLKVFYTGDEKPPNSNGKKNESDEHKDLGSNPD